jgi:hypothetical protein
MASGMGGQWLIALKSSTNHQWAWADAGDNAENVFADQFPALHKHFAKHREALQKRGNQGTYWWELSGNNSWDRYISPKIMYQEIQYHSCYMLDRSGMLANNKVFFLPTEDLYLLGVLNSPVLWWHNWRYLPHVKDEALTPAGFKMEGPHIAQPNKNLRAKVEKAVGRLIERTTASQLGGRAMLDWLRVEFAVEKPSQRLQNLAALDADTLIGEVKKARGKTKSLSVAEVKRLREEHVRSVAPLHTLAAEARQLEMQVSDLVNAAYGLTPDEVALMWRTAPPRMPVWPPGSVDSGPVR